MFERFKLLGPGAKPKWIVQEYSLNRSNLEIKPNFRFDSKEENILEALTPIVKAFEIYSNESRIAFRSEEPDFNKPTFGGIFFENEAVIISSFKPDKFENFLKNDLKLNSNRLDSDIIDNSPIMDTVGDYTVWYEYKSIGEGLSILGEMIRHKNDEIPYSMSYGVGKEFKIGFDSFKYFREMEDFWERDTISNLENSREKILDKICLVFSLDYEEEKLIDDLRDFKEKEQSILNEKYRKAPEVFDNFIEKYGVGDPDDRAKLNKLLTSKGVELTEKEIHLTCRLKWEEKQRSELGNYVKQGEKDVISKFLDKYGVGDSRSRKHLAEILDKPILEVEKTLKEEYLRNEERDDLEEFEEELFDGNKTKDPLKELEDSKWDWEDINQIDGLNFERVLSEIFEELGYDAEVTQGSGDQGADLIIRKNGEKTVFQAKRYSDKVSNSAIQEVVASKQHYNAEKGMVVTNSNFTNSAESLARSNDIELWNGSKLRKELKNI